jgi:acetolactate synthase-1/3 small subunit
VTATRAVSGHATAGHGAPGSAPDHANERHVISALVVDRPGTLNRVAGLFRARSFNIESLTVGTTLQPGRSRMTIVIGGDDAHLAQVLAQLERLVEVIAVHDLTHQPSLELELALVELDVPATTEARAAIAAAIDRAGGRIAETGEHTWRLSLTAPPAEVEAALDALRDLGVREIVRAGSVALPHHP